MKQINIFVDDRVGVLADISYLLGKSKINIESISAAAVGKKALISLTVKEDKRAKQLLEANKYKVLSSDVLVVRLPDAPGELAKVSKILSDAGINIGNANIMEKGNGVTLLGILTDKHKQAEKLLAGYLAPE